MKLNSQLGSSSEGHAIQYCVFLGFMLQLLSWAHTVFSTKFISASFVLFAWASTCQNTMRNPRGILAFPAP